MRIEKNGSDEVRLQAADPYDYEIVNGRKIRVRPKESGTEIDENGYFRRQGNQYTRTFPGVSGAVGEIAGVDLYGRKTQGKLPELPVEPWRYRLVWAKGCHWSNRAAIVRELEGLDDVISVNLAGHGEGHQKNLGWEYVYSENNTDPLLGDQFLSEAYYRAEEDYGGRTTVPALIDVTTGKVVSNDYNWLTNYFEVSFRPFHKKGAPDLYPEALRDEIDRENLWLFDNINNAVYRCWFAQSKEGYAQGYRTFYAAMDVLEKRLAKNRFLFGDYVTDSDVRLFVTLARLDIRYTFQLGETKHRLVDYPNLWGYARELWQIPAFRNNTYFADFANPEVNDRGAYRASYNYRFLKQIDFDALWNQPSDRAKLSKDPAHKFLAETDGGAARTENGFAGFSRTAGEQEAWEKDAAAYARIHAIPSTSSLVPGTPAVKSPEDFPAFADDREAQKEAILREISRVPEKPDLSLLSGIQTAEEKTDAEARLAEAEKYVRDSVTDTLTTLLTSVKLADFDEAYSVLYAAFDQLEERLSARRFLLGDYVSAADVELFTSLVRFDAGYSRQMGATKHRLVDYPNLWGYARDLYQIPAFWHSTDWKKIIANVDPNAEGANYSPNTFYDVVLPKADLDELWKTETERAYLSSDPTHEFLLTDNRRFNR